MGWAVIDSMPADQALQVPFTVMSSVPMSLRPHWREAVAEVMGAVHESTPDLDAERALKWLSMSPRLLLRKARRGGRRGRDECHARFEAFRLGQCDRIMDWHLRDVHEFTIRQRPSGAGGEKRRALSRAKLLMSAREMSKAKSLSLSHGLADLNDPTFLQQMKAKHGKASVPVASGLAAHGPAGFADIQMPSIMEAVRVLRKNEHPGPGGFRNEFMNVLADESAGGHDRLKNGLDAFAKLHVQADLPDWHYLMATAVDLFGAFTNGQCVKARPIAVGASLRRLINEVQVESLREPLRDQMFPAQIAVGTPSGAGILVTAVREAWQCTPILCAQVWTSQTVTTPGNGRRFCRTLQTTRTPGVPVWCRCCGRSIVTRAAFSSTVSKVFTVNVEVTKGIL